MVLHEIDPFSELEFESLEKSEQRRERGAGMRREADKEIQIRIRCGVFSGG